MSAFVVDGCLRHIQSLNFVVSGSIFTHTNKLNSSLGQGALDRGMGNGEEERSSHAACWKREAVYSFGWTNGGAEDTLGFHGGHTLLQPLYGQ